MLYARAKHMGSDPKGKVAMLLGRMICVRWDRVRPLAQMHLRTTSLSTIIAISTCDCRNPACKKLREMAMGEFRRRTETFH